MNNSNTRDFTLKYKNKRYTNLIKVETNNGAIVCCFSIANIGLDKIYITFKNNLLFMVKFINSGEEICIKYFADYCLVSKTKHERIEYFYEIENEEKTIESLRIGHSFNKTFTLIFRNNEHTWNSNNQKIYSIRKTEIETNNLDYITFTRIIKEINNIPKFLENYFLPTFKKMKENNKELLEPKLLRNIIGYI
jgi:hypothetical protein